MVFACCVRGCQTISKNGLHSFPSNKELSYKWILAIKANELIESLNENKLARSYRKVCKKHFRECDFIQNDDGKSQLVSNSVPSLFLPPDEIVIVKEEVNELENNIEPTNMKSSESPKLLTPLKRLQFRKRFKVHSTVNSSNSLNIKQEESTLVENESQEIVVYPESEPGNCITQESYLALMIAEKKLLRKVKYFKKRVKDLRQQLTKKKINDVSVMEYLSKKFNETQQEFVGMQLKNHGRMKCGRRYSTKQKDMCLAFYKEGPGLYRFLEKSFVLPTKRTIGRHSAGLLFKAGIDYKVLDAIKDVVEDWPEKDRYCSLQWGEVNQRIPTTHSLTFIVRGFSVSFKQSIGHFSASTLHSFELVELVKLVIEAVSTTGLQPILSICNQVNTNESTVNLLVDPTGKTNTNEGQLLVYNVGGRKIIHCFDPSHLITTVRNNLLTEDLKHTIAKHWSNDDHNTSGTIKTASWHHIIDLYAMDKNSTERLLPKLTNEHIIPEKIMKTKVSHASQVLSMTFGRVMLDCIQEKQLPDSYDGTAQMLIFMNDIFDSINGSAHENEGTLKSAVEVTSMHFSFWEYALSMLPKMNFVDRANGKINNRSIVLKNLESTIRGYMAISKMCFELGIEKVSISTGWILGYSLKIVPLREKSNPMNFVTTISENTSKDGLENFFVNPCNRFDMPSPTEYRTEYGNMTISNVTSLNASLFNYETDEEMNDDIIVFQPESDTEMN